MKLFKKTTVLLAMFLMLSSTSFADEAAFKATFDGQNITTTETELRGNIDNSNLQVEVIQQSGEQTSVIYTGRLGGYDNGNWNNIDFSDINFLVLFEWESADNEAIYIVPIQENTTDLANNSMSVMSVESESLNDTSPLCNTTLMYDNDYYEGALKINNTLNVAIDVENATKDIVCYIAEYSSTGVLLDLIAGATITIPTPDTSNGKFSVVATKTFTNADTDEAKVMIWEASQIKPIANVIELDAQGNDYYADNMADAQLYDMSKKFYGKINSTSDIDYIKFKPAVSGEYIVGNSAAMAVSGTLYNEQGTVVSECNSITNGYYIKADLVADNIYYLKTTSDNVGEYRLSINNTESYSSDVILTNNSVNIEQNCDNGEYTVSLYNNSGTVLHTVNSTVVNNKLSADLNITTSSPEYSITVKKDGFIVSAYKIKTIQETKQFEVTKDDYISVPVTVSNTADLTDIYFAVAFNDSEFLVFDVCEHTYTISETGTGLISNAEVNIKAIESDAVVFTSTKTVSENTVIDVNTVKLQALFDGNYTVKIIAYSVN